MATGALKFPLSERADGKLRRQEGQRQEDDRKNKAEEVVEGEEKG